MVKIHILTLISLFFYISIFSGCATKDEFELKEISFSDLSNFKNSDLNSSLFTFIKGCEKLEKKEPFNSLCKNAKVQNPKEFFETNFKPYKIFYNSSPKGLITGYYEATLKGSRVKNDKFIYPIYKKPKDLLVIDLSSIYPELKKYRLRGRLENGVVIPFYEREDIDEKGLLNNEIIAYVDDYIELFFLHIQGSGKVILDSGEVIKVGYAEQNGYPYYAIGKSLVNEFNIPKDEVSMQRIRKFLLDNPNLAKDIMYKNRSYIFFDELKGDGAIGALGVSLTPNYSLAVDKSYIPLGLPLFIETKEPINGAKIDRVMVAQDVGGAIKGAIRADFFFGNGKNAEDLAGLMKSEGELTIFIPNGYELIYGELKAIK